MATRGNVIIMSAPSGTGKSTLLQRVMAGDDRLVFSISHTTRSPRQGEKDGREYYFTRRNHFEAMIDKGAFLEWAEFSGNYYGTTKEEVERKQKEGLDILLDIEVLGARQVMEQLPEAVSIFILPPSYEELAKRLYGRAKDPEAAIQRRLQRAKEEVQCVREFDYVLINDQLETCVKEFQTIVQSARYRYISRQKQAEAIATSFG